MRVKRPAVVVFGPSGVAVGKQVASVIDGEVHGFHVRSIDSDVTFTKFFTHLQQLYAGGRPLIGICASGILIRAVAPLLANKRTDPPVVVVAEDGSAVVPLLGGHYGANELARRIAKALGIQAAITTASELREGLVLDNPPMGWRLANPEAVKETMADILAGKSIALVNETAVAATWLSSLPINAEARRRIIVTERPHSSVESLLYYPATFVLGVGCERQAPAEELIALAEATLAEAGISHLAVACIASIDLKAAEPAVHAVARHFDLPARFFDAARLEAEAPRLATPSDVVFRETGCHGVAEGAALAGVGSAGRLVVPKRRAARSTAALAQSPSALLDWRIGRERGRLSIVGIGPGSAEGLTREAEAALREATDWVGYRLYLDLLAPLAAGKTLYDYDLGRETDRVRRALDLAAEGRHVALVSSGDAGIYAMASLVFEMIEHGERPDWARLEIEGLPGVSAMQVAAARVGAPLGHDFCAISLSTLLTRAETIHRRLRAAVEGDFVIALYNPASLTRRDQIVQAQAMLLRVRPPETPVVLARNLGRAGESVRVTTLGAFDPADVDMMTIVLVGSSETRRVARADGSGDWVYTPRGYRRIRTPGKAKDGKETA